MDRNSLNIGLKDTIKTTSASGRIGDVVGDKDHAPINILLVALILLFAVFAAILFAPLGDGLSRDNLATAVLSAITFSIGLLFGKKT